jgi:hypothetical protein
MSTPSLRSSPKSTTPIKTPMGTNGHLDLDLGGTSVDQKVYRSMIGYLLYLCASRPNIMLSVCMCARFQSAPKDCHLRVVKRIMRYLVLTPNLGLWYPKGSHFELIGYSDVDYARCKVDRKSASGTCQFLGQSLDLQRNKILLPYPRPKRSMSPPVVVVHNFYGCDKLSRTMVTLWTVSLSYVTMRVPSRLLTTLVSTLEPNT